jgi:hypothetical protein
MRVIDPGHKYKVSYLENKGEDTITFVKRMGPGFPGNNSEYSGTNCQELLRVLIDRVLYLDNQKSSKLNLIILSSLRVALWCFESRAAQLKGYSFSKPQKNIEKLPFCSYCGHIANCEERKCEF